MRTWWLAVVLAHGLVALSAPNAGAVDPVGPFCLQRLPLGDTLQLFMLPAGGPNFLISGRIGPAATGTPLSGSGYLTGNSFRFSVSGQATNAPGRLSITAGTLDVNTGTGSGECYTVGTSGTCGAGTAVTYTSVACPAP